MDLKDRWIYCSERMPPPDHNRSPVWKADTVPDVWNESKPCLVGILNKDYSRQLGAGVYCRRYDGSEYWSGTAEDGKDLRDLNVIAWQPFPRLPDPPLKEGS